MACAEFASGSVWEAGNTELSNAFQICSSNAFGFASPLVNPSSSGLSDIAGQHKTNPQPSLSHCARSSDSPACVPEHVRVNMRQSCSISGSLNQRRQIRFIETLSGVIIQHPSRGGS
jgi:hypothetical protein